MSRHHYPIGTLYSDYLRVAVGLALTLGPLLLLDLAAPIAWLLSALALLFVWFALRTGLRQLSVVELSPQGIAIRGPLGRSLAWDDLTRMKLAYYAPRAWSGARRRDRQHERGERDEGQRGWLQLSLQGTRGRKIRVEFDPRRLRSGAPPRHGCGRTQAARPRSDHHGEPERARPRSRWRGPPAAQAGCIRSRPGCNAGSQGLSLSQASSSSDVIVWPR